MQTLLSQFLRRDVAPLDSIRAGNLEALISKDSSEIEAAQRLRYRSFSETDLLAKQQDAEPIDRDVFDVFCDHLIVRTRDDWRVVGTCRILSPDQARRIGRYEIENQFDMRALDPIRPGLVELGRACVEPGFRAGPVVMLLWSALGEYMANRRHTHVIGCVGVPTWDGGHLAASVYRTLTADSKSPSAAFTVTPREPLPLLRLCDRLEPVMPPLLKGYLRAGGKIVGEPHWDRQFQSADYPMMVPVSRFTPRYARRFAPIAGSLVG